MAGITASSSPTYTPAAPWAELRAWIDHHEAWEQQHGRPAELTDKELAGLSSLVPLAVTPHMSDSNHVGDLGMYAQIKGIQLFYENCSITTWVQGASKPMWQVFVVLQRLSADDNLVQDRFPKEGWGFEPGGQQVLFEGKKQAKQYAAMCAMSFLRQNPPPMASIPQAAQRAAPQTTKRQAGKSPHMTTRAVKRHCAKPLGKAASELDDKQEDDGSPTELAPNRTQLIAKGPRKNPTTIKQAEAHALAQKMALGPLRYIIKPDEDNPGCFAGFASFQPGTHAPTKLAFVRNAPSESEATAKIVEEVLAWLNKEWQRRNDLRATFLKGIVAIDE